MKFNAISGFLLVSFGLVPALAFAAPPAKPARSTPPAQTSSPGATGPSEEREGKESKVAEARATYERGLALYEAGDYDAARVQFERAYSIAPSYRILFNIGLVQKAKQDYVGALRSFETYLAEGGSSLPEVRKLEINNEIGELRDIIGSALVSTNVEGAEVFVDDISVGKTPLRETLLLNPGRRRISATKQGRLPATKVVEIASKDHITLKLELAEGRQVVVVGSRRVPWVGWGIAGALAITAGITGYVALNASNDLDEARRKFPADPERLDAYSSRTTTFGIIADVAAVGAIAAGGISLYYTLKWGHEHDEREKAAQPETDRRAFAPSNVRVQLSPARVGLSATF